MIFFFGEIYTIDMISEKTMLILERQSVMEINRRMVEQSDLVIVYVERNAGFSIINIKGRKKGISLDFSLLFW